MNRDTFVDKTLESLINKDPRVKHHFETSDEKQHPYLENMLKDSLEVAYDTSAKDYFNAKGIKSLGAKALRYLGAGSDIAGTAAFYALGGLGLPAKIAGTGLKSIADYLDYKQFSKFADDNQKTLLKNAKRAGKTGLRRVAAFLPTGIGDLEDLRHGLRKYDKAIAQQTTDFAVDDFIKRVETYKESQENKGKIIPLDRFKSNYAGNEDQEYKKAA